jgi:hypothetical protein
VAGARVVRVPTSPELRLDLERLGKTARSTNARIAWVCDPNNPTGSRVDADEWRALLDAVPPGCLVVADEAYMDYVEPAERPGRERDVAQGRRVVVLRTFSKLFGSRGCGWATRSPNAELVRLWLAVQEPFNVNRAALAAGLASLGRPAEVANRRDAARAARDRLGAALNAAGLRPLPSHANFLLCELGVDDQELGERLLRRGVLVRTGRGLGLPGWARITVGPDPLMDRAAAARCWRRATSSWRRRRDAAHRGAARDPGVCREFAAREIRPAAAAIDEADVEHPAALWDQAAALGLTSFMLPEALGGGGMTDCLTGCIVQEELSTAARYRQPAHLQRLLRRAVLALGTRSSRSGGSRRCTAPAAARPRWRSRSRGAARTPLRSARPRAGGARLRALAARRRGSPTAGSPSST